MLVAAVVNQLTNTRIDKFADEMLFKPLNIKPYIWAGTFNSDLINAAWSLGLKARDLIKIGLLVLNKGHWGANGLYGYGYHWWYGRHKQTDKNLDVITALGSGGQRIFVLPQEALVVTILAADYGADWLKPEAIFNRIFDAQWRE